MKIFFDLFIFMLCIQPSMLVSSRLIPAKWVQSITISSLEQRQTFESIAIDLNGNIYLADIGMHRIVLVNEQGQIVKQAGGFGWGEEQFNKPAGICAVNGLDVFIADRNNHRIHRYDRHLNFIQFIPSDKNAFNTNLFGFPSDAAMTNLNELIILDYENNRAVKLNREFEVSAILGDREPGAGRLKNPDRLHVSQNDKIFITEQKTSRIIVYDQFGNFLYEIRHPDLKETGGFTWFPPGFLLICDIEQNKVFIINDKGSASAVLLLPEKRYIDAAYFQDRFYLLNQDENMIEVFEVDRDRIERIQ